MIFLNLFTLILLIVLGVLFIPVVVDLEYTDDFKFKISFLKITLFSSEKEKKADRKKSGDKHKGKKKKSSVLRDTKAYFKKVKNKKGFTGAVKDVMHLISGIFSHIKWLLRRINICKVRLNINVGTPDAALTAIEYGSVCSAVYPVTAMLDSVAHIGFKEINVNADFENGKSDFGFKARVKMQVVYLLISAFKIYRTLKKFITENIENE